MYEQIAANKRNTLLIFAMVILLLGGLGYIVGEVAQPGAGVVGLAIMLGVALVWISVAVFSGDRIIRSMAGARPAPEGEFPMLHNVVEEMAIAAGVPKPAVYVMDEEAPNAFATGRDPAHAAVTVTTGLLKMLNRDELQGVVAHEIGHIKNRDILYAVVVAIIVGLIALVCEVILRSFRYRMFSGGRSRGRGAGGAQLVLLVVLVLFAVLAPISATLLQLAVSRQREYLADASGAQFTRYPHGLARALEKIAADPQPLHAANRATQHLFIVNPLRALKNASNSYVWSTHPPIQERIKRLNQMAFAA
jgi:heat shock protein HtpX